MVGDSVMFSELITLDGAWDWSKVLAISILQESGNKAVIQAATSRNQIFTATENILEAPFKLYSTNNKVFFQADNVENYQIQVFDLQGKMLRQFNSNGNDVWTFGDLKTGVYLVRVQAEDKVWAKLLPIVN